MTKITNSRIGKTYVAPKYLIGQPVITQQEIVQGVMSAVLKLDLAAYNRLKKTIKV